MAAKLGQTTAPAAGGAAIARSSRIAELLATGQRHHQAGQLAEAEGCYRKILAIDQNHCDSLHRLGVIAHQAGKSDMAADLIGKAIALNDRMPAFHNSLGLVFGALGRREEAVVHFRRALALNPQFAEAHNNLGIALKEQGKLDEAAAHYRQAVGLRPTFAEAHNNLGIALKEQGKLNEAVARYRQSLALKPNYAEAHYNLGNVLREQGKLDEAVSHYHRALAVAPNFAKAHNNLGNALKEQGKLDEAAAAYRRALTARPDFAETHHNLGNALKERGKLDEAVAAYQRALALEPDFAEAHNNLGTALQEQGKTAEAAARYRRALVLDPDYAKAHANLGKALLAGGDPVRALDAIQRSIEIDESENAKLLFVECVSGLSFVPPGVGLRNNLVRALSEPWGRPADMARFCAILLKCSGAVSAGIDRVTRAWPTRLPAQDLFSPTEFAEICDDRLLRCLLEATLVCDIELERLLTAIRFVLLEAATADIHSHPVEETALRFFSALAQQCFINEYVFAHTDGEIEQAQRLRAGLIEALSSGTPIPGLWLVAVAAYLPLADLPVADLILPRPWSAPVAALVARQVRERQEERQLRASMPRLTVIEDGVSGLVQQQYEENPYPRWIKPAPVGKSMTIDRHLRARFPLAALGDISNTRGLEILIAGCGTGQHSIETARQFAGAQVLAVDLSLTSLCYAKRKTRELGLNNVEYAQADILRLDSIGRVFDLIEASGSLHHLEDQLAGWRLLLSILRPGGFMRLGLYSRTARRDINDARSFIAKRGYGSSAEDIRGCRQELMAHGDDTPLKRTTKLMDFFSTSACRDLLFHVQETQLTLPEISDFVRQNRLEFLGFELRGHVLQSFRQRFPDDTTMTELDRWQTFEAENPSTFISMYQFWIRKPH